MPAWEAEANVFIVLIHRDEDDILLGEGVEQQDGDLSAEERIFLEEFPILKRELEVAIRRCHALADDIDRTHKTFTKTDLVTNSISAVSGMMTILGLALAPATAGGSLALSTAGQGLGTVAMVTSIFTNISKHLHNKRAQAQASSQMPTPDQEIKEAMEKVVLTLNARKAVLDCGSKITDIKKNVRALQTARAHPQLATAAQRLLTSGRVSARRSRQVQRAFEGTTLVLKRNARLLGGVMAGLSLGTDMRALFKDWKRLQEGAKAELAEELRARAQELERKLSQLTQLYESLQQVRLLSLSGGAGRRGTCTRG